MTQFQSARPILADRIAAAEALRLEHMIETDDGPDRTDAHPYDRDGLLYPGASPANLRELATMIAGKTISCERADIYKEVRLWHERRGGTWPAFNSVASNERLYAGIDDVPMPRNWVLAADRERIVPPGLRGPARVAWAQKWRDGIPALAGSELIVIAAPGREVSFITWWDEAQDESEATRWTRSISGHVAEGSSPRFRALKALYAAEPIYLPSAHEAPAALPTAASRAPAPSETGKLRTGIAALDGLPFGAPGIERNRLVVLAGTKGSGKSSLAFEVAETALAAGDAVLWVAHDERPEQIDARRLVRRGCSHEVAERRPPEQLAKLEPLPFWVIGKADAIETSWEIAHDCARDQGRPLVVVIDSLQQANLAALGDLRGQRDRIDAALSAISECQARWPATVIVTSEATRTGEAKGSTGIGHAADIEIALSRAGDTIKVKVLKYRAGREGSTVELALDRLGQRVLDPEAAARAEANAELRAAILEAVRKLGGLATGAKVEARVSAKGDRVRAELKAMVEDGALEQTPKGYRAQT